VLTLLLSVALSVLAVGKPSGRWGIGIAVVEGQSGMSGDTNANAAGVSITDDGMAWYEYEEGKKRQGNRDFRIGGMKREYTLRLHINQTKQPDGAWKTNYADIGMPRPIEGNWYHSGFVRLHANNQFIQVTDPEVEIVETGAQGLLDFKWDHALARFRIRFVLQSGSDHLLMEVRWEAKLELKSLRISFVCYPQGFRVSEPDRLKGVGLNRHMVTAERDVEQVTTTDLNVATEWWQFYQDNTLEKSPTYGPGGCALAFVPEEIEQATARVGDYAVELTVTAKPVGGRARFAIWDFNGTPNVIALKTLREIASAVRKAMTGDSWLPTSIAFFDAAKEFARLDELAKSLGKSAEPKIASLRQQVAAIMSQRGEFTTALSFAEEANLRKKIAAYRLAYWQAERPALATVRTLFLAGPWAYAWRVDEAARKKWGPNSVRQGGYIWKYWAGNFLTYFPSTLEELLCYDVVVLADLPQDPFTEDKRQMLADYVKNGGGMLVLGGMFSGGSGKWQESPLEPLLPVEMGGVFDLKPCGGALALTATGAQRLGKVSDALGMVPWRVGVAQRKGAEVWMTAGKEPFAVCRKAGTGRVLYILGTSYGEAPTGRTAFWDAPGWPVVVVRMLSWLARGK
jgi:uncharacterized membrane protein